MPHPFHRTLLIALAAGSLLAAAPPQDPPPVPDDLPARYRTWLEDVAPLLSAKEREAFLAVRQDYQRQAFIRRFWQVRDPFPQTARNELQERWEERVRVAREKFGGLTEDRARMLLINGEPKEVFQVRCELLLPMEIWSYPGTDRIKTQFSLAFVSAQGGLKGPYRLWGPTQGINTLLSQALRVQTQDVAAISAAISEVCPRGDDIAARLGEAIDWHYVEERIDVVPRPGDEWVSGFASASTDVPEGAQTFPAELDLSFPGRFGSRTVVQGLASVPREEVRPGKVEGTSTSTYNFLIDGEILYKDELFDHFRYRFTLPEADAQADTKIPLVFQRYLRPGSYKLVVKIEDLTGKRYFRDERELQVPFVEGTATAQTPAAPAAPAAQPAQAALAEANAPAAIGSDEQTIRLLPPPPGLATGKARVEAAVTGDKIVRVSFELDGKPVLTKGRPPFSVELNLGLQPRTHVVRAIAQSASGEKLAEDEILLNAGPHRFSVRLVEPQAGRTYKTSLRAQAVVDVPEGDSLERVELYLGESLVATLYQPPFTQPLLLPSDTVQYVRAVAFLTDGNSTEDTVLINTPDTGERVDVDFVELYTTVADNKGRPVEGLNKEDFRVFEDGTEQEVRRFELVRDVPIYAGILLDTSSSMGEGDKLDSAVRGALRFFQTVLTPKDRASVITFADQPTLAVRFTNQEPVLAGGLAGLTADGNTALYDSLIYALYYFGGVRGKRAIIILSDGKDEGSRYPYNEALEYAKRSGVALYTVGIGLSSRDADVRLKLNRLSEETGGRSFFVDRASELDRVYESIEGELRSQYLLAYQSTNLKRDEKFRTIEVKLAKPGLEAKTLKGYYP
ncbi:MAG TPA: VWA domain-containing protein [Thermoanaerobaculia bacterium]|nr:VWA domain-containing protein [Thermoanaerobaculia bacterium]